MNGIPTPAQAIEGISHKYNYDNIFIRTVIAGVINILNDRLYLLYRLSDTETKTHYVPFYYSMTGDERALQDFYLNWNDCVQPKTVDGNIDVLPRGMVKMNSVSINTASLTNYHVRGDFVRENADNQLSTYSAKLHSIPVKMTFEVEIQSDTLEDSWKIWEKVIEVFWPTVASSVRWNYVRIPFQIGFPADFPSEKLYSWSFGAINASNVNINMKFNLDLETYYPIFDKNSELFKGQAITGFTSSDELYLDENGQLLAKPNILEINVPLPGSLSGDSYIVGGAYWGVSFDPTLPNQVGHSVALKYIGTSKSTGNPLFKVLNFYTDVTDSSSVHTLTENTSINYSKIFDGSAYIAIDQIPGSTVATEPNNTQNYSIYTIATPVEDRANISMKNNKDLSGLIEANLPILENIAKNFDDEA